MNRTIAILSSLIITPLVLFPPTLTSVAQTPTPTEIFAKVMNPAFAEQYQAKTIQTTAKFVAAGSTEGYMWGAIPAEAMNDKVSFRVVPLDTAVNTGGFGSVPPHVFIAKDKSNLVFQLKQGDSVVLTGRTVVGQQYGMTQVIFAAESIARPPVKPTKKNIRKK
jgi:hypothetical protein